MMVKCNLTLFTIAFISNFIFNEQVMAASPCAIFPMDNIWNTNITNLPVHQKSAIWIKNIGLNTQIRSDFGPSRYWGFGQEVGIPVNYVNSNTPKFNIKFDYQKESDQQPYPIPSKVKIEGGGESGDRHIISLNTDTCVLYELFRSIQLPNGEWTAGSGAIYNLNTNNLRPAGWTSADAAGLPIYPGLAKYEEVKSGSIKHALRFTIPKTSRYYLWPARHFASKSSDLSIPPMGIRMRLKQDIDISKLPQQARVIAKALKEYGMILADNGGPLFISGVPNEQWDNQQLKSLKQLIARDFEIIDTSSLQLNINSAQSSKP